MSFLAWIIVGLIAGWLARAVVPGPEPGGIATTLILGVIGAIVGGWIATLLNLAPPTGVNIWSIVLSFVGAVVVLLIWNAVRGRRVA